MSLASCFNDGGLLHAVSNHTLDLCAALGFYAGPVRYGQGCNTAPQGGYALIELNGWDEAGAAYKASLKLYPKNQIAKNELIYIQQETKKLKDT